VHKLPRNLGTTSKLQMDQNVDMKTVPHWGPKNIWCLPTNLSRLSTLALCIELYCILKTVKHRYLWRNSMYTSTVKGE
jgi:hypothetical protein